MSLKVITQRCPQNHRCPAMSVCPAGALSQISMEAPAVDNDKCIECGRCVRFCPKNALVLDKER
jgi:Fe-S-cluster-containing hydrogenase component 2